MSPCLHSERGQRAGRYVYCIGPGQEEELGEIGIEGRPVYTVVCRDICALVHDCAPDPYQSDDRDIAGAWILAHHRVVSTAWQRWGAALPLTFNTIVKGGEHNVEDNLRAWLHGEYESLKARLEALAGKAEYGVQLFWDPALAAKQVAAASAEVSRLEEEIRSKPRGLAYMYRQKLEHILRREMAGRAEAQFRDAYGRISRRVDRLRLEKAKPGTEERPMLLHVSCLVAAGRYPDLEAELEQIAQTEGLSVRLTGPLPPYSFC